MERFMFHSSRRDAGSLVQEDSFYELIDNDALKNIVVTTFSRSFFPETQIMDDKHNRSCIYGICALHNISMATSC